MASPSVTYTFSNSTVADADEVNTNFTDLINAMSDGTKDFSISALVCAGSATFNGNVTLGNASSDDVTFTGSLASSIPIKTTNTYNIGSATSGLAGIYFGTADTDTVRVVAAAQAAARTYTFPDAGGSAEFVMTTAGTTITAVNAGSYTPTLSFSNISAGTAQQHNWIRVNNIVYVTGGVSAITVTTTATDAYIDINLPVATANFSSLYQATGSGGLFRSVGGQKDAAAVNSNSGAQTVRILVELTTVPTSGSGAYMTYSFSYEIQ